MKEGFVCLVGAGCGAADLLTLRGKERLHTCTAVVYDDLIDPAILDFVPPPALRVYMGKRSGQHSAPQDAISTKLVELARSGHLVVRLKGGDPFVFGRGGEEILALQAAGIPCEVVPGITSAIAIPSAAGIPVTHRGLSRSFHVITGHTADTPDGLPYNLKALAQLDGTLVFLMGLNHLPAIARRLMEAGKPGSTPAAVLSGGNSPNPATVRATLADIAEKAAQVLPPAVIVIGPTAALDLSPTLSRPLEGLRVGITGTPAVTETLFASLRALGAQVTLPVCSVPVMRPDLPAPEKFLPTVPCWVVFTSANGVELFFRHLAQHKTDLRRLSNCKFAVIGPSTGAALASHGLYADLCPEESTSLALGLALRGVVRPEEPVLLFRSADGAPVLRECLKDQGLSITDLAAYDLHWTGIDALPPLDYLTFASASGVKAFFQRYDDLPAQTTCVCIGEVTARAFRQQTDRPCLVAQKPSVQGIVHAILNHHRP